MRQTALLIAALVAATLGHVAVPAARPRGPLIPREPAPAVAKGGALDPAKPTNPPVVDEQSPGAATTGDLTIQIQNKYGSPLSVSLGGNAGAPTPVGNPKTVAPLASSTQYVFPTDWAGRIVVGKNTDPAGSKIEASLSAPNYLPDIDVSYVDGYTVPIVCSCSGTPVTGCNYQLFQNATGSAKCENEGPGPICYNPEQNVPNGPASPFFAPCAGAAYTFPNDNAANVGCKSHNIQCCIGTSCQAVPRQPKKAG